MIVINDTKIHLYDLQNVPCHDAIRGQQHHVRGPVARQVHPGWRRRPGSARVEPRGRRAANSSSRTNIARASIHPQLLRRRQRRLCAGQRAHSRRSESSALTRPARTQRAGRQDLCVAANAGPPAGTPSRHWARSTASRGTRATRASLRRVGRQDGARVGRGGEGGRGDGDSASGDDGVALTAAMRRTAATRTAQPTAAARRGSSSGESGKRGVWCGEAARPSDLPANA